MRYSSCRRRGSSCDPRRSIAWAPNPKLMWGLHSLPPSLPGRQSAEARIDTPGSRDMIWLATGRASLGRKSVIHSVQIYSMPRYSWHFEGHWCSPTPPHYSLFSTRKLNAAIPDQGPPRQSWRGAVWGRRQAHVMLILPSFQRTTRRSWARDISPTVKGPKISYAKILGSVPDLTMELT